MLFFNQMFDSMEEKHITQSSQSKYRKKQFLVVDKQVMRFQHANTQKTHERRKLQSQNNV